MPACSVKCPVVKAELRKIVTEAPWLLEASMQKESPPPKTFKDPNLERSTVYDDGAGPSMKSGRSPVKGQLNRDAYCQVDCFGCSPVENFLCKFEERQRNLDIYLTKKGRGYFEDVCTCCLSCVLRALRDDPFVRSTITSLLIFSLGFKLTLELDAWYLPPRMA